MEFSEQLQHYLNKLNGKGVFLNAGSKPNTMTASWGFCGVMWSKPIIIVPVRTSRFTHDLILKDKEFSVSVPLGSDLNKMLGYFGTVSGRDTDKYKEQNINMIKCKNIDTFVFPGNCMQFECKLIFSNNLENLDDDIKKKFYSNASSHTMFYGEIVNSYKTV